MNKKSVRIRPKKMSVCSTEKVEDYEKDFFKWTKQQANYLEKKLFKNLDLQNLIEEIESLGKSEKRELRNYMVNLLMHKLKKEYQPSKYTKSWDNTISNCLTAIDLIIEDSPSLKSKVPEIFSTSYEYAKQKAVNETGLDEEVFPEECPWKIEEVLKGTNLIKKMKIKPRA